MLRTDRLCVYSILTPWLVINDGKRTSLNYISLTFTYRGGDIVDVDWDIDCMCQYCALASLLHEFH
jgi:hypothetical protein